MAALIESAASASLGSMTYYLGRAINDELLNLFAMKMPAFFIVFHLHYRVADGTCPALDGAAASWPSLLSLTVSPVSFECTAAARNDPLPSLNDGTAKQAIISFVQKTPSQPEFRTSRQARCRI